MDTSEQIAEEYLTSLALGSVEYEPDGKVPPDFLVDRRIAVKVRRLNQNESAGAGFRGLEETAIPLQMRMRRLLKSLGPPASGGSWFVCYRFQRPIPEWKALRKIVRERLVAFRQRPAPASRQRITLELAGYPPTTLDLIRASSPHATCFVPGGYSDGDSGGWVLGETQKNLRPCVAAKSRKIAPCGTGILSGG